MKQIDIIKTYSQKRCLVVDANPDIRTALKRLLVDFGASDVDTAGQAQEAMEACQQHNYDIVLSDYILGKGRNGQQLLEELRHEGLLKNTAVFIMITAEAGVQHVVHALEYEPDDYLSKPISREGLRPRLDFAVMRKEALSEINKALDLKRPQAAIEACLSFLKEPGKYKNDAKKLLAELYCAEKRFVDALEVYQDIGTTKCPVWAKIGKAEALLGLQRLDEAEPLLLELVDENQYCVEALDLLAQLYQGKNKLDQAQHTLSRAVTISPMSASRQREMGRICMRVGDKNAATHAFRAAIKHSKNSCQESAEDYINLAQSLTNLLASGADESEKSAREALETLQFLNKKYTKQPIVQMRRRMLEADVYRARNNPDKAQEADQKALDIFKDIQFSVVENTSIQLCIDCAKALMDRGCYDEGERLLQEVSKVNHDPALALQIDKLLREPITKEGIAHAAMLNKRGIEFHKVEAFDEATKAFQKVLGELPNHIGLNLNLVQSILSKSKQQSVDDKELALIQGCLQRVGSINDDSPYRQRYDYLIKRVEKLIASKKEG